MTLFVCRNEKCPAQRNVDGDIDEDDDVRCEECHRLMVRPEDMYGKVALLCLDRLCQKISISEDKGEKMSCDWCGHKHTKEVGAQYRICIEADCPSSYHGAAPFKNDECDTYLPVKSRYCQKPAVELNNDVVESLPLTRRAPDEDQQTSGPVRRLRAALRDAERFIDSSGTHHPTTPGAHTSSAQERHTAAHRTKMIVRNSYVGRIEGLVGEVKCKTPDELTRKLQSRVNRVLGGLPAK